MAAIHISDGQISSKICDGVLLLRLQLCETSPNEVQIHIRIIKSLWWNSPRINIKRVQTQASNSGQ
jgi:hypothetical protein